MQYKFIDRNLTKPAQMTVEEAVAIAQSVGCELKGEIINGEMVTHVKHLVMIMDDGAIYEWHGKNWKLKGSYEPITGDDAFEKTI